MIQIATLTAAVILMSSIAAAATCPFEQAGASLTREGLVLTRYAIGLRGASLVQNTDLVETDAPNVEATISCNTCSLDINGDGNFDAIDATIVARRLAGLNGDSLTNGLDLGSGTRSTTAAIQSFLTSGCGVNVAKHSLHNVVTTGAGANLCTSSFTRIDHVLANDNPNAIIIVTANIATSIAVPVPNTIKGAPYVFYSPSSFWGTSCAGRWLIGYASATSYNMVDGLKFNLSIVANPD